MEFKVGDIVRILDRVGDGADYSPRYISTMLEYAGTITSIKELTSYGSIRVDNNDYYWDKKAIKLISEYKYLHPSELKDGDFIKIWNNSDNTFIYIFKEYKDNYIYRYANVNLKSNRLNIDPYPCWSCFDLSTKITYATEEEKNLLNQALLKEGYIWDNINKKLVEVGSATLTTIEQSDLGIVSMPYDTDIIAINKYAMLNDELYTEKTQEEPKEELDLFPTKKHYQLNFIINN